MEESVGSFLSLMREMFSFEKRDLRTYSPLTLAYIGDAIYDLVIRTLVVENGNCQPNLLHKRTSSLVKAHTQAEMIEGLLPMLTEEERSVYKRGRNAKSVTMAKNATMHDYRKATGFEALMGHLYLKDQTERMLELIREGLILVKAGGVGSLAEPQAEMKKARDEE